MDNCPFCGSDTGYVEYTQLEKWSRYASFDRSELEYTEGEFIRIEWEPKTGRTTCCNKRIYLKEIGL